jgi:D-serine deaminase-like pyridoxal phosphate-dependent protein
MPRSSLQLADLPTPALLLDRDRLEANLARMAERCDALGVTLRPHLKTHKCVEVADLQRDHGARGVTVSTLYEARVFADHGVDDITWAFPFIPSRLDEARRLAERVTLRITLDASQTLELLEAAGVPFHVWLKIDCGYHRAGVDPDAPAALELARRLAASRILRFDGLLTHSGHAYHAATRAELRTIAEQERQAVAGLRARLAAEGITVAASVGSTPAMSAVTSLAGVQEARPGNYAFYDGMQLGLGSCAATDCAVTVLATVVSSRPGAAHCVVDAGALALSKDTAPQLPAAGFGTVYEDYASGTLLADGRLTSLSQEHGVLFPALPVGTRVRILPNHSCLTVACFDEYHVVEGDTIVDHWKIWRGR